MSNNPVATTALGTTGVNELAGKNCLITAAASGMGRSSAELFAAHGAHVIAVDRDAEAGSDLVDAVSTAGGSIEFHQVDLLDIAAIEAFVATISTTHDRLDVLFNNAGMPGTPGIEFDPAGWARVVGLNLTAPIALTGLVTPLLKASGNASVIFNASIAGLVASPNSPTYSAAKGGVLGYMRALSAALGPSGIRSNAVCPAATRTPMLNKFFGGGTDTPDEEVADAGVAAFINAVPLGRVAVPEEIAEVALFLAGPRSSFVNGVAIPVDGGYVAK